MKKTLTHLFDYQRLTRQESADVLTNIGEGKYNESQIAAFISVYLMRSIELEELVGFRDALLNMAIKVDLSAYNPIDIVGTGGDGKNTFNISTLSCFVLAGAGYKVAKHGNYGATSVSGASNVLEFYGAKFFTDSGLLEKSIDESGVAYLHAPLFNPAMKNVAPVRRALGVRTFFNVLGPLINPAQPNYQVLGVYNLKMMRLYNFINQKIGCQYTLVHGLDGYDEVSLTAETRIISNKKDMVLSPTDLGFKILQQAELSGGDNIEDAAKIFINVLNYTATEAQIAVVVANSAFAIQTLCADYSYDECKAIALESIQSGSAKKSFEKFLEIYK